MYYRGNGNPGMVAPGLGIDPVTLITAGQFVAKTLSQYQHPQDPTRFQANAEAANAALAGDADALAYLHQRTGRYPAAVVDYAPPSSPNSAGQAIAGWATEGPRLDAADKEAQVKQRTGVRGVVAGVSDNWMTWAIGAGLLFAIMRSRRAR